MKRILNSRRLAAVFLLGFSSGIPLALTGGGTTFNAWLKGYNVDLAAIGLFNLVGLPYALKFLWSPLMDRYAPGFMGRRRGWILIAQILLALTIAIMGFGNPAAHPLSTVILAILVAFFSASQDIVVDAYRTDVLEKDELGPGAALYILGYRVALLVSGGVALILQHILGWHTVFLVMAATLAIGAFASFFAPEPSRPAPAPKTLQEAVIEPFFEFFKRSGALEVLLFILLYKIDMVWASAMSTPFILDIGFSNADIGTINKGLGLIATIAGTGAAGTLMVTLGMRRSLIYFGLAQGVSNLTFMALAHVGHSYPMLVSAIGIENFCSGLGTVAYVAFMMSLCDKRFTASQYALLTSFMALTRVVGSSPTGFVAKALGWQSYYLVTTLIAIPGLALLIFRFNSWASTSFESLASAKKIKRTDPVR